LPEISFFLLRDDEIHAYVNRIPYRLLDQGSCRGIDTNAYHPEVGVPAEDDLARCNNCAANVACVAMALRAEDPEARAGWYGGLGPAERAELADRLGLVTPEPALPERAAQAIQLFNDGWTVNTIASELGCCRRTVQRYLRMPA
jgi:AraC-like DNA-binding protein